MSDHKANARSSPGVVMDVRVGQSLMIGDVKVTVEKKGGRHARLRVVADKGIVICRPPQDRAATAALVPG